MEAAWRMTTNELAQDTTPPETLIAGAGMAGLMAAHTLLARRPATRVLVVEPGPGLAGREHQEPGSMVGLGGAGLYLGGRLFLGPAAIPVLPPVSAPPGVRSVLSGEAYLAHARQVEALLVRLGARGEVRAAPDPRLAAAARAAAEVGVEYILSYPVRLVGAEERRQALAALHAELVRMGARFAFGWRVVAATRRDGAGFAVTLAATSAVAPAPDREVACATLLLAPGRYGAEWLVATVRTLGAAVLEMPIAFGVRAELPQATYAPLTALNPDPRLQRVVAGDAVIKTYATCPGGSVVAIARYGALVASGVPATPETRGPSTTFAVLAQPGAQGARGDWRGGEALARRLNARVPGRLVVQRLADVRANRPTTAATLARGAVRPTCAEARPGTLHDVYPPAYWEAFEDFVQGIAHLAPGSDAPDVLLYGPAEERFWQFPTDERLETNLPGLFVAGDAAGQTQGALQAGVAGTLAGEGLAARLTG